MMRTVSQIFDSLSDRGKFCAYSIVGYACETGKNLLHVNKNTIDPWQQECIDAYSWMNKEQKTVVDYLIRDAIEQFKHM